MRYTKNPCRTRGTLKSYLFILLQNRPITVTKNFHKIRWDVRYRRVIYSASYGGLNADGRIVCARGVELPGSEMESSSSLIKRGMALQWDGC